MHHLSIGQAACALGVSVSTMRRWEKEGYFCSSFRTFGGHRRYDLQAIEQFFGRPDNLTPRASKAIAYARVSSHDQLRDLETQKQKLATYCSEHFDDFLLIADLGSGLNYKKPGLKKLMDLLLRGQFTHLVLNHKDRLLRFGSDIIFSLCKHFDVKVVILEDRGTASFEEQLAADVIELMTVFSSRLYGRRSHQNKRALAA